jgi:hypothetical protein
MTEEKNITIRENLKDYFQTGDYPTESQFGELIDAYAHLNEFNFGLSVKPSGDTFNKYYHFYNSDNPQKSGAGHKIVEAIPTIEALKEEEAMEKALTFKSRKKVDMSIEINPEDIKGYKHILSRNVLYKKLNIELVGNIDIEKYQPKIIIERYKQRKIMPSGFRKPAGFYQEKPSDAAKWNRKSEYKVDANKMVLDLEPIHYFRPNYSTDFKYFSPSGSLNRPGSFQYSRHQKVFVPIQLSLQILINGIAYTSKPVGLKIILGSAYEKDAINFIF